MTTIYRGFDIYPSEGGYRWTNELLAQSGPDGKPFATEDAAMDAIDRHKRALQAATHAPNGDQN